MPAEFSVSRPSIRCPAPSKTTFEAWISMQISWLLFVISFFRTYVPGWVITIFCPLYVTSVAAAGVAATARTTTNSMAQAMNPCVYLIRLIDSPDIMFENESPRIPCERRGDLTALKLIRSRMMYNYSNHHLNFSHSYTG